MSATLDHAERLRRDVTPQSGRAWKSRFGQFMTPSATARFMASLFADGGDEDCHLLDAGAGLGALSCAFVDRWVNEEFRFRQLALDAFEQDALLRGHLAETLNHYACKEGFTANVLGGDFIEQMVNRLQFGQPVQYTHAILNPPYKKISGSSRHRLLLRQSGIETVNLYSAFVALALEAMAPGGRLVAIIPRSFCNGPYYRPFRRFVRDRAAIRHLHLFASRTQAFRDDAVLQESLIIVLDRAGAQGDVIVSTSTDDSYADYGEHRYAFERIVLDGDTQEFIHVPTAPGTNMLERCARISSCLDDLDIQVSTGPVVDFRMREHLSDTLRSDDVPLLYPQHFVGHLLEWPKLGGKKPNAIARNGDTEKWLFPSGTYTVVRRFSSKEEKRRIVANVVSPSMLPDVSKIGFENHLNVFHCHRLSLPDLLAHGLAVYLNSTPVDDWFRRFNGHTQVNATDLRSLRYPDAASLAELGAWALRQDDSLSQSCIDERIHAWLV